MTKSTVVHVQPVVLASIIDHFSRRNDKELQVIGTLLGYHSKEEDAFYVNACVPVPHRINGKTAAVDFKTHMMFTENHREIFTEDFVLGWYSTGDLNEHSPIIHDYYSRSAQNSEEVLHLLLNNSMSAFSVHCLVDEKFIELPSSLLCDRVDKICLDLFQRHKQVGESIYSLPDDKQNIDAINRNLASITDLLQFQQKPNVSANVHDEIEAEQKYLNLANRLYQNISAKKIQ